MYCWTTTVHILYFIKCFQYESTTSRNWPTLHSYKYCYGKFLHNGELGKHSTLLLSSFAAAPFIFSKITYSLRWPAHHKINICAVGGGWRQRKSTQKIMLANNWPLIFKEKATPVGKNGTTHSEFFCLFILSF